jgi:hypothetical protein
VLGQKEKWTGGSFLEKFVDPEWLFNHIATLWQWLLDQVLVLGSLGQLSAILVAALISWFSAPYVRTWTNKLDRWRSAGHWVIRARDTLSDLSFPIIWLVLQWLFGSIAEQARWPHHLLTITVSLLTAWIVIRLFAPKFYHSFLIVNVRYWGVERTLFSVGNKGRC